MTWNEKWGSLGFRPYPAQNSAGVGPISAILQVSVLARSQVGSPTQAYSQSSHPVHCQPEGDASTMAFHVGVVVQQAGCEVVEGVTGLSQDCLNVSYGYGNTLVVQGSCVVQQVRRSPANARTRVTNYSERLS